jgi:hypothetical protein
MTHLFTTFSNTLKKCCKIKMATSVVNLSLVMIETRVKIVQDCNIYQNDKWKESAGYEKT